MTRIPDRFYAGHLRWTRRGEVLATWRVAQPLHRATNVETAADNRALHHQLLAALPGHEVHIQGVLTWTDPGQIIDRMISGVDLEASPAYAQECDAALDMLAELPLGTRRYWVTVTLTPHWKRAPREAFNRICDDIDLAPLKPSRKEVEDCLAEAARLEAEMPPEFAMTRATEAEHVWLWRNAQSRSGAFVDPVADPQLAEEMIDISGRAAVGQPVLDPSGLSDIADDKTRSKAPIQRRYLGVYSDHEDEGFYQSGLVMTALPSGHVGTDLHYHAAEILGRIDETEVPTDFAIRTTVHSRAAAARANKKAMKGLVDQLDQTSEAGVNHSGRMLRLHQAAGTLAGYNAEIEMDPKAIETRPIILLSTPAGDGPTASAQARTIVNSPLMDKVTLARPVGGEKSIFWAMQPGTRIHPQLSDRRQIGSAWDLAALAPLVSNELGHDSGHLAGVVTSTPLLKPWLLDLFGRVANNEAPTLTVSGRQGSGKSAFLKGLGGAIVDRGGRIVAIDASADREWLRFAKILGQEGSWTPTVIDMASPSRSLDMLAADIDPALAGPMLRTFLILLLNVSATSPEGRILAKTLSEQSIRENGLHSTGRFRDYLANECPLPGADQIADLMDVFADQNSSGALAAAMFDSALEPADLSSRAVVFGTSNVALPTENELNQSHLYQTLGIEKIFGRALYTLIAALGQMSCFADRSEDAALIVDEAHHITRTSPESAGVCGHFARHGRRGRAALLMGTHAPISDIPDEVLRGLISNRLCMWQTDDVLAAEQAEFLGFHKADHPEEWREVVDTTLTFPENTGAAYYRDGRRRVGTVRTLLPARPERREAVLSTPPTRSNSR